SARERWRRALIFTLPCLCVGLLLLAYNQARFDSPFEFGHRYLAGGRLLRVQNHGLFGMIYLKKNLIAAFTLLPLLLPTAPFLKVSWHGVAIQLSSPGLIWALIPRTWSRLSALALLYMLPLLVLLLLYQNTGWVQVSYRFIIDLLPPLLILTALNGRQIDRIWRGAILWSVLFNLLAAAAFHRAWFQPIFVDLPKLFPH
ncbi:MAG: hypothetical protein VYD19_02915, partial [Myxococcota bacterium]|nr:hypothetical protein [Myxococcota bacterium]